MAMRGPLGSTALLATVLGLSAGCSRLHTTPVPAGLSGGTVSNAARLTEDGDHPLILRGVDRQPVPLRVRMPALVTHHYLLASGKHLLWVQSEASVLYPLPIPLGNIRCYALEADLTAGQTYRMQEEEQERQARLLDGAGRVVAKGRLVDEFWSGTRTCAWP